MSVTRIPFFAFKTVNLAMISEAVEKQKVNRRITYVP